MKWTDYMKKYSDKESCKREWKKYRDQVGVICPHCGSKDHYWKGDKECYECKKCKYRQSLRSNTVMHGSQLPFHYWFIAIQMLTYTKKSISAKELQRQLGHKSYNPIWAMLHKLRNAMGKRDSQYELCGTIELDEGFFSTEIPEEEKNKPLKRGRGSQKKTTVLVMAETASGKDDDPKSGKKPTAVKHIKMLVVDSLKAVDIDPKVKENINPESAIISDSSTSYTNFKSLVREHYSQVIPKEQIGKVLPWVHIAISNAKRTLLDIFHDIAPGYLQNYLNEFCWKFNRRYFGEALFDRLVVTAASYKNDFRYNIG